MFLCQSVFTFYLFRRENPKAAFLTPKCLSWKVLRKHVVHLVATSNSWKPDSWDVSPKVTSPVARVKHAQMPRGSGDGRLTRGQPLLGGNSYLPLEPIGDTTGLCLPSPRPPAHPSREKGPLTGKSAVLLLPFKMFLCFS